jgi:hypothetical protein
MMKCIHKITKKEGIIQYTMGDYVGVFWTFKYDKDTPNHYFWNSIDTIEIIN